MIANRRVDSSFPEHGRTAWITAQRPARASGLDPFRPHDFFLEDERDISGQAVRSAVILLTNKECPWRCLMCDLWQNTLTKSVPNGAIPGQIDYALQGLHCRPEQVKLYNSGSFFDPAAIPMADYAAVAGKVSFARHVVVESHPRLIGGRALQLRDLLIGSLEVAMGLETVHPEILQRLNKRFTLSHFVKAAEFLRQANVDVRAFVLVKPPFMDEAEGLEWAVKSAEFAFDCGASVVSLIPTRPGNGAMEHLAAVGDFSPPRLDTLEQALALAIQLRRGRVFADTWDLQRFATCHACLEQRQQRLRAMNLAQGILPLVECELCAAL